MIEPAPTESELVWLHYPTGERFPVRWSSDGPASDGHKVFRAFVPHQARAVDGLMIRVNPRTAWVIAMDRLGVVA